MAPRRNKLPADRRRYLRPSAGRYYGQSPTNLHSRRVAPFEHLVNKLSWQAAEIDRLSRYAKSKEETNEATRQDFVSSQREINKHKKQIRSIRKYRGKKIRNQLDRIANMETYIDSGERIKKGLEEARIKKQSLLAAKHELTSKMQQYSQELEEAQTDIKRLPEILAELKEERRQIRMSFDRMKASNIKKAEQMRLMDNNRADMAKEVRRLRVELLDAKRQPIGEGRAQSVATTDRDRSGNSQGREYATTYSRGE